MIQEGVLFFYSIVEVQIFCRSNRSCYTKIPYPALINIIVTGTMVLSIPRSIKLQYLKFALSAAGKFLPAA